MKNIWHLQRKRLALWVAYTLKSHLYFKSWWTQYLFSSLLKNLKINLNPSSDMSLSYSVRTRNSSYWTFDWYDGFPYIFPFIHVIYFKPCRWNSSYLTSFVNTSVIRFNISSFNYTCQIIFVTLAVRKRVFCANYVCINAFIYAL